MQILTGKEVAENVYESLHSDCNAFVKKYGFPPTLAVVLVGSDPASQSLSLIHI